MRWPLLPAAAALLAACASVPAARPEAVAITPVAPRAGVGPAALPAPAVVAVPQAAPGTGPVTATATARRDIAWSETATCDLTTVTALAGRHGGVRQFVVVATDDWTDTTASVEVAARDAGGTWRCQRAAVASRVGRSGTRPLVQRRSGDGTTPAGVFGLGRVTAWDGQVVEFFGNAPDPGVRGAYRQVRQEDCWGATPGAARYQHLIASPGCGSPDEWLARFGDVYGHAAVIGANLDPISGDAPGETPYAAAIFLHRFSYDGNGASRPTSGCVSLAQGDLVATLRLIDPGLGIRFAIGPRDWLRSTA